MVTQNAVDRDIEINLRAVAGELAELPRRPEEMDRYGDWGLDWIEVMSRLEWLLELAGQGALNSGQHAQYEQLLRQLRDCLPLTEQLDLPVPGTILDAVRVLDRVA